MLRKIASAAAIAVLTIIVYATVVPISLRPNSGHLHLERQLAYFAVGGTLTIAFPRQWLWLVAVVVVIACGLEYAQTFTPTRDGRLADAAEKSVGGLLDIAAGLGFSTVVKRMFP